MEENRQETVNTQESENTEHTEKKENSIRKEGIFREKSLERISEPEQLHDYIRVTSPGIWLVLLAVVVLLAGVFVWGVFGRLAIHDSEGVQKEVAPITLVTN